nr:variable large family protein [Borrelia persica]
MGLKAYAKKSEIGNSFSEIKSIRQTKKAKLNEILDENGNYSKVNDEMKKCIEKLIKIEGGTKKFALVATGGVIGQVVKSSVNGVHGPDAGIVKSLVEVIKEIVDLVIRGSDVVSPAEEDKKGIGRLLRLRVLVLLMMKNLGIQRRRMQLLQLE